MSSHGGMGFIKIVLSMYKDVGLIPSTIRKERRKERREKRGNKD